MVQQPFDQQGEPRNRLAMAVEMTFRREQSGVEQLYERVELVGMELHGRGGEEQHSTRQVFGRRKITNQIVKAGST